MPNRAVWAEIDLGALRNNYREIKRHLQPGARLCAVVKADAYGHGAVQVARIAVEEGASYLAVATVDEGIELRRAGFTTPIIMLGLTLPESAVDIVAYDITQTVCELPLAEAISREAVRQGKLARVHLKVETGMGRIGIRPEEVGELAAAVAALPNIEIEGMFSHFAAADTADKTFAHEQLALFEQAISSVTERAGRPRICHSAESAAALEIPESHLDMVRAGIIQYGLWPSAEVTHPIALRPVMSLRARVVFLKTMPAGATIGYGRTWRAERESRIATLTLGYADGFIRAYGRDGYVTIKGHRCPIAGRICMDQTMVDVTDYPDIEEGDVATLFGAGGPSADEVAERADTINYEVTSLLKRVERRYVEEA